MCVFIYVCLYLCICIYPYTCMYLCMHWCMNICIHFSVCKLTESGPWEWGLFYQGLWVWQDPGRCRGVAKPYRGLWYQRWLLTEFFWNSFGIFSTYSYLFFRGWHSGVDNPEEKGRSRLKRCHKKSANGHLWYKRPRHSLATPSYLPRSSKP